MASLQDYVTLARIAEQAERYEEMKEYIKKVATTIPEGQDRAQLTPEERNMFSLAYKNLIGSKRNAWRTVVSIIQKDPRDEQCGPLIRELKEKIEKEIADLCEEVETVISECLAGEKPGDILNVDDFLYYMKMKGDYYRYEAEFMIDDARETAVANSMKYYKQAIDVALAKKVVAISPTLLGLYLNYSVFLYEIIGQENEAREVATKAFEDAMKVIEDIPEKDYKNSSPILQLLRDNLRLWASDIEK